MKSQSIRSVVAWTAAVLKRCLRLRFACVCLLERCGFKCGVLCASFPQMLRSRPPFTGVLLGPGPESAPRSAFWAILGTCLGVPQRVLFECFLAFLGPKNAKKHSKSTLWGTPRQVPKIAQKALRGALSGPGPKSTPVNGGRDRNPNAHGD